MKLLLSNISSEAVLTIPRAGTLFFSLSLALHDVSLSAIKGLVDSPRLNNAGGVYRRVLYYKLVFVFSWANR